MRAVLWIVVGVGVLVMLCGLAGETGVAGAPGTRHTLVGWVLLSHSLLCEIQTMLFGFMIVVIGCTSLLLSTR